MRKADPVLGMRGYGTHGQPPGTWSDDGALILCTVESLVEEHFNTADMGRRFVRWMYYGLWAATGSAFDVGNATASALMRIERGAEAEHAGGCQEHDNGNGSLMRIAPVALRFATESRDDLLDKVHRASAITHGHERSKMACGFFGLMIQHLLRGQPRNEAFEQSRSEFVEKFKSSKELGRFGALLQGDIARFPEHQVSTTGYVVDTLVASVWCLLTTGTYSECVLTAVNLGGDTDTTGCVAGALAGTAYGMHAIPEEWRTALARNAEVNNLLERFANLNA